MGSMRNWMLGAAVVVGGLGLGATTANAAQFGIYARGPAAYVSPYPGPGYVWIDGYMANGYWIAGRWNFEGDRDGGRYERFDGDRGWNRDRDRGWDRDRDRGWNRDRDRGWNRDRGWDRDRGRNFNRRDDRNRDGDRFRR